MGPDASGCQKGILLNDIDRGDAVPFSVPGGKNMKTAQAGTLESMDCIVTVTEAEKGRGISISMEGASIVRFGEAMLKATKDTLKSLGVRDISVSIQDNGAGDLVLKARVEAAVKRLAGVKAA